MILKIVAIVCSLLGTPAHAVEPEPHPWFIPLSVAPRPGDELSNQQAASLKDYVVSNAEKWEAEAGPAPETPLDDPPNEGPPMCEERLPWLSLCHDVNGEPFHLMRLELDEGVYYTFCENMQGEVYSCNGFAQP